MLQQPKLCKKILRETDPTIVIKKKKNIPNHRIHATQAGQIPKKKK
jgi:hypothetical protein